MGKNMTRGGLGVIFAKGRRLPRCKANTNARAAAAAAKKGRIVGIQVCG